MSTLFYFVVSTSGSILDLNSDPNFNTLRRKTHMKRHTRQKIVENAKKRKTEEEEVGEVKSLADFLPFEEFPRELICNVFSFVKGKKSLVSLRKTCRTFRDYLDAAGILQLNLNVASFLQKQGIKKLLTRPKFLQMIVQGFPTTSSITVNSFAYLSDLHLLSNLKSIVIEENTVGRISDKTLCWPQNLTYLEMNTSKIFNSAKKCLENIPMSVETLHIKNGYNIGKAVGNLNLVHLRYEGEFATDEELCALPSTLTSFETLLRKSDIDGSFLSKLPSTLLDLKLSWTGERRLVTWTADDFPKSLQSLTLFGCRKNYLPITITTLPTHLTVLDITIPTLQPIKDLPPTLRTLRLFSNYLLDFQPPPPLRFLHLQDCYSNTNTYQLHANIQYLILENVPMMSLSAADLPPNLKYLHLDLVPIVSADKVEQFPAHPWGLVFLNMNLLPAVVEYIKKVLPSLRYFECDRIKANKEIAEMQKNMKLMNEASSVEKVHRAFWNLPDEDEEDV